MQVKYSTIRSLHNTISRFNRIQQQVYISISLALRGLIKRLPHNIWHCLEICKLMQWSFTNLRKNRFHAKSVVEFHTQELMMIPAPKLAKMCISMATRFGRFFMEQPWVWLARVFATVTLASHLDRETPTDKGELYMCSVPFLGLIKMSYTLLPGWCFQSNTILIYLGTFQPFWNA